MKRVVVTGMGAVTAAGVGCAKLWDKVSRGETLIGPSRTVPCVVAEFSEFEAAEFLEKKIITTTDRFAQFALVAAGEALSSAGPALNTVEADHAAVIIGSAYGGLQTMESAYAKVYGDGASHLHPSVIPKSMMHAAASQISMVYGIRGPSYAMSSACASSAHALGHAFRSIRSGEINQALVGGVDCAISAANLKAWQALRVLAPDSCRPFSSGRRGLVIGEGAGILLLEDLETARCRGANIVCELAGYGAASDANDITAVNVGGMSRAMRQAMADAGTMPRHVSYVNAHGTGTLMNDAAESQAIRNCFSEVAKLPLVSSSKAVVGHTLGAAGAIEAIVTCMAISARIVPPTGNFLADDPKCGIDCVPHGPLEVAIPVALSNSFAFGGTNVSLLFRNLDVARQTTSAIA